MLNLSEILIIAAIFAGEEGMERVVKVVAPLGVQPVAAVYRWGNDFTVVEVAFGEEEEASP